MKKWKEKKEAEWNGVNMEKRNKGNKREGNDVQWIVVVQNEPTTANLFLHHSNPFLHQIS